MERDKGYRRIYVDSKISTHTLTWSVTVPLIIKVYKQNISTHTLTWSVTSTGELIPDCGIDFNSHAHVERDAGKHK